MTLHHLIFNPYEVNTCIVAAASGECAVIDPACCSAGEQHALKEYIAYRGLIPALLINTHGHFDHVIGNAFVCKTWQVKSVAHRNDRFLMENAWRQGEIFGYDVEQPPATDRFVDDGDTIDFDDVSLLVRHVPGHSPGSIVLCHDVQKFVIAGDVLFRGSIGRTDLPGGNHRMLIDGIRSRLMTLPDDTKVYPGHGPATEIGYEKKYNPFINRWYTALAD